MDPLKELKDLELESIPDLDLPKDQLDIIRRDMRRNYVNQFNVLRELARVSKAVGDVEAFQRQLDQARQLAKSIIEVDKLLNSDS